MPFHTRFYVPRRKARRSTQGPKQQVVRPKLSPEVRRDAIRKREKNRKEYREALNNALAKIDEITAEVATIHRKSIRRVQEDLHMVSQLKRKRQQKTNAWNAWIWHISQDAEKSGVHNSLYFDVLSC
jgi:hypothetical protein